MAYARIIRRGARGDIAPAGARNVQPRFGLTHAYAPFTGYQGEGLVNYVDGSFAPFSSTEPPTWETTRFGRAIQTVGSATNDAQYLDVGVLGGTAGTIVFTGVFDDAPSDDRLWGNDGSANGPCGTDGSVFRIWRGSWLTIFTGIPSPGEIFTLVAAYDGTNVTGYLDGQKGSTGTCAWGYATNTFDLCGSYLRTHGNSFDGQVLQLLIYNRALSDAEAIQHSRRPIDYSVWESTRTYFVPDAAGGGGVSIPAAYHHYRQMHLG